MSGRTRAALLVLGTVVGVVGLLFVGGQSIGCLGPIGHTQIQCIAAFDDSHNVDWSPGPGDRAWVVAAIAIALVAAAVVRWPAVSGRGRAAVLGFAAAGALIGALTYEVTRPVSLTGPMSSGAVITVLFPANGEARLFDAVVGAGVASLIAGLVFASRAGARSTRPVS